jgi:hypothetical protein
MDRTGRSTGLATFHDQAKFFFVFSKIFWRVDGQRAIGCRTASIALALHALDPA